MTKQVDRLDLVSKAFALGDALGDPFEFASPTLGEVQEVLADTSLLRWTDDTILMRNSAECVVEVGNMGLAHKSPEWWRELRGLQCTRFVRWLRLEDPRGMGTTTRHAINQMIDDTYRKKDLRDFKINRPLYPYETSAGNGILSRALPYLISGFEMDANFQANLELTHLHELGHRAVVDLDLILRGQPPLTIHEKLAGPDKQGFFSLETLAIAHKAVTEAKTIEELLWFSMRKAGDNDSTAALAFGLKAHFSPNFFENELANILFKRLESF